MFVPPAIVAIACVLNTAKTFGVTATMRDPAPFWEARCHPWSAETLGCAVLRRPSGMEQGGILASRWAAPCDYGHWLAEVRVAQRANPIRPAHLAIGVHRAEAQLANEFT